VYAAVHVAEEGTARDDIETAYRAYLPPLRGAFVVVAPGVPDRAVEVDEPPRSWPVLLEVAAGG
jgi:hypothetical protein